MRKRSQRGLAAFAALALALHASAGAPVAQGFVASFDWSENDPAFGGLSAIELDDTGTSFTALTDRGTLYQGRLQRQANGQITRIVDVIAHELHGRDDQPLNNTQDDSEGLAIAPDGRIFVSFEGPARILRFASPDAPARGLPRDPDFAAMQPNSALEALAIDPQGMLYTLPERSGAMDRPFPVYRYANRSWTQPFSIPRDGEYLPTAADFGPDGQLYILERNFQGILGFQSRVRRYAVSGDTISAGETVLETALGEHSNLEGLSVWRDAEGTLRLTMVSDDNFRFFLSTTLVEYAIAD
ncbi:MAG: esterase-like activity of phytase family protein [Paracoccaceae bacterium]